MNNRINRLVGKKRKDMAAKNKDSSLVREQKREEQEASDNVVHYTESRLEPLQYEYEGKTYTIPCETEDGEPMTYHDQHYQATRLRSGLPIEAKRMRDYYFSYEDASLKDDTKSLSELVVSDEEASEEYQRMKEQHEAQHPTDED